MSELLERAEADHSDAESRRAPGHPHRPGSATDADAFAAALTELALTVHAEDTDTLAVITEGAVDLIPGTEFSAVVLPAGPGQLETRATCGPQTVEVIGLQNEVGEGPCLDAVRQLEAVWVSNLATESRWPLFSPAANRLGVGSMMCTPLVAQDRIYGSLSLAAGRPDAFDEESRALAAVFAAHAAIALAGRHWRRNMIVALDSRDVIGQAKGILMERYRLSADAAFALLVKASQNSHTKLRTLSDELCRTGVLPTG
jgi:transcriptional regulator with GAF, ATPase, and Fis domain